MLRSLEYADTGGRWSGLLEEGSDSVRHEALTIAYRDRQDQAIAADARARGCATLFDWMEVGLGGGGSTLFLEQWGAVGHPHHPCSKTRLGFSTAEAFCYAPEFGNGFAVPFLAVRRENLAVEAGTAEPDVSDRIARLFPEMMARWRSELLRRGLRSEEHTSELQSLMRISYAVLCLKKKKNHKQN